MTQHRHGQGIHEHTSSTIFFCPVILCSESCFLQGLPFDYVDPAPIGTSAWQGLGFLAVKTSETASNDNISLTRIAAHQPRRCSPLQRPSTAPARFPHPMVLRDQGRHRLPVERRWCLRIARISSWDSARV